MYVLQKHKYCHMELEVLPFDDKVLPFEATSLAENTARKFTFFAKKINFLQILAFQSNVYK